MLKLALVVFGVLAVAQAQRNPARGRSIGEEERQATTPVPILRQINKVNEDGSYTYGYESADGSYKIETKSKEGEVRGKYGYYDDAGTLREIEYGASRQGFNPQGTDVKLPESAPAMEYDPVDDTGFYDAEKYERPFSYNPQNYQAAAAPATTGRRPGGRRAGARRQQKQFAQFAAAQPQPQAPVQEQQHVVNYQQAAPAPQQNYYQPAPVPQQNYYQPQAPTVAPFNPAQLFHGHPAKNIDINTGSYSINYSG